MNSNFLYQNYIDVNLVYDKIIEILKKHERNITDCVERSDNKDGSVSINIYKNLAVKIIFRPKSRYLNVKSKYSDLFMDLGLSISSIKSENDFIRYMFHDLNNIDEIEKILLQIYDECEASVHQFGCCSRYEECSNAKLCIHPDLVYSQGCWYRKNLEAGKIFYGINANQNLLKNQTN